MSIFLSIFIILAEFLILFQVNFGVIWGGAPETELGYLLFYITSMVVLFYMCHCTYSGLFDLKVSKYYAIHTNKQTDEYSLLYSASFLTYLASPLCLNFCKILNINGTAFHRMVGAMDPIPFIGQTF